MTAEQMIDQARDEAEAMGLGTIGTLYSERDLLRDIIQHPYPMTSPEL